MVKLKFEALRAVLCPRANLSEEKMMQMAHVHPKRSFAYNYVNLFAYPNHGWQRNIDS